MAHKQSKPPQPAPPEKPDSTRPAVDPVVEEETPRQDIPRFPVVGIGASAGGIEAVKQVLQALPADTGMAFVLVQHLDPTHASMLTEILSRATSMPVSEVTDQMAVEPNHVYVIPPGMNMAISQGTLRLSPREETPGQHRVVDHFLHSLAEDRGHKAIGVILSGSATDGTLGLEAIKAEGGITFAQDDTAQHKSMPRSASAAGCVDFVLPPDEIAREIVRISRHPYVAPGAEAAVEGAREPKLNEVLDQLRFATGVDFSNYKRNTLYRRVTRRVVLHKMEGLGDYVRFLQSNPAEVEALYQDVLISVTSFFRNPEAFEMLKGKVFPRLTQERSRHEAMRIWVLGCSTGEEAYSIAIAFAEFGEASGRQIPLQLFATDLNGVGIEKARAGIYSKTVTQEVSPERLRRFFVEMDGNYRITKSIRDTCVFARHNVLSEPPFSRIDLISCRNMLIYLEPSLQQRVLSILHYALQPKGFLWLGGSETIGAYRDLFEMEDAKQKIYVKKLGAKRVTVDLLPTPLRAEPRAAGQPGREVGGPGTDVQREADRLLLARYAPASVLVNAELEIVQFRGDTGRYLAPSPGKASLNLLKMLREGLLVGVRGAVHKARRSEAPAREEGLRIKSNGGYRSVNVQVIPVKRNGGPEEHFLVLFEEAALGPQPRGKQARLKMAKAKVAGRRERESSEHEIARLTQELAATREYLQSVIEQQEAANEELQSSNEEVQSANEELQSTNEELETSKEEIQSSNEELATVNEELHNRNLELNQSINDFVNLLASVQLPIVMLGSDLRIRRFTPMAEKLFKLIPADVGRPITDIKLTVDIPDLEQMLADVVETASVKEREVRDKQGRWYLLRIRPYRTLESRIDGAVLLLVDVDSVKRSEQTLRRQAELLDQVDEAIFVWEIDGGIVYWNRGAEEVYGYTRENALGRNVDELLATSPPASVFKDAMLKRGHWMGELSHTGRDGRQIVVDSRMVLEPGSDPRRLVLETDHVITERKEMEQTLRDRAEKLAAADRNKNEFLAMLAHELRNPLAPLSNALQILNEPPDPEHGADHRRSPRCQRADTRQSPASPPAGEGGRAGRSCRRAERASDRGARPGALDLTAAGRRLCGGRRGEAGAGPGQPAQQCLEVHAPRRPYLADRGARAGEGWRARRGYHPGEGRRHRNERGAGAARVRPLHAGGPLSGPQPGGIGNRPHRGPAPHRGSWWQRRGVEPGSRPGQRVRLAAADHVGRRGSRLPGGTADGSCPGQGWRPARPRCRRQCGCGQDPGDGLEPGRTRGAGQPRRTDHTRQRDRFLAAGHLPRHRYARHGRIRNSPPAPPAPRAGEGAPGRRHRLRPGGRPPSGEGGRIRSLSDQAGPGAHRAPAGRPAPTEGLGPIPRAIPVPGRTSFPDLSSASAVAVRHRLAV